MHEDDLSPKSHRCRKTPRTSWVLYCKQIWQRLTVCCNLPFFMNQTANICKPSPICLGATAVTVRVRRVSSQKASSLKVMPRGSPWYMLKLITTTMVYAIGCRIWRKRKKIYLSMHSAAVMFQPGRRSRAVKMLRISRFLNLVCTGLYNTQSVCHKSQFTCVWACAVKPASFSITCQLSSWQLWKIIIRWTKSCLAWANCSPSIHVTAAVSAGRGGCLKIISGLYPLKHGAIFYARKTKICLEMWQRQVGRGAKDVTRSRTCSIVSSWQTPSLWATPASLWKCWIWTEVQRDVCSGASHKNDALRSHTSKYNSRGQKLKTFPDDLLQQSNPRTLKQP